jgi:hypothetical protein
MEVTMRAHSRFVALISAPAMAVALGATFASGLLAPLNAVAGCNGGYGGHYYTNAVSGSGNTPGTGANTNTWTHWSVANNGVNFSDEAVWLISSSNNNNAIEGGIYSGSGSNVAWTNSVLPYYTTNNGANEHDGAGDNFSANQAIFMWVQDDTVPRLAYAQIGPYGFQIGYYFVNKPAENYSQGETYNNNGVWMGGGSGETFYGKWQDTSGNWNPWGFHNDCADYPYYNTHLNNQQWTSGGY